MSEPRNVTPGGPPHAEPAAHSTVDEEFRRRYYTERAQEPEWMAWKWARGGRGFPWLGVLLVLLGVGLLAQYLVPGLTLGTLVLLAVGIAFLAGWAIGGSSFAVVPGVLFAALGLSELIEDLALLGPAGEDVPGLASSALAIGLLVIWLIGYARGRRSTWPLWGAALFGLIGVAQLTGRLINVPALGFLWPVVIIVVGVVLLANARRGTAGR
jgi:hypothetical protein